MILPMNKNGHVTIEVDLEIDDNISRNHRCSFFINSELGCVERFGKRLNDFIFKGVGAEIVMTPDVWTFATKGLVWDSLGRDVDCPITICKPSGSVYLIGVLQ